MSNETLPPPLVPAEADLRDFDYMELDVRRLRDSSFAARVSAEAFRAGVLLWCASWHQVPTGSLPDDDIDLAQLAGYGRVVKEWRKVKQEALHGFIRCSDGRLYHETISEKARAAWNSRLRHHYDRARDRLRKANKAREAERLPLLAELSFEQWNVQRLAAGTPMDGTDAFATVPPEADSVPPENTSTSAGIPPENHLRGSGTERRGNGTETSGCGEAPLQAEPPAGVPPPAPPVPPASPHRKPSVATLEGRLPPDWQLPQAWGDWAAKEWPVWTAEKVRAEAEKFRDHWLAKAGRDAVKADWLAAWRKWCRDPLAHRDDPAPGATSSGSDWTESRRGIEGMGEKLGIGRWDEEASQHSRGPHWMEYRARVFKAAGIETQKAA